MKKKYVHVSLMTNWRWKLDLSSPQKYNFNSIEGLSFINPIYYKNYLKQDSTSDYDQIENCVLMRSNILLFEFNSGVDYERVSNEVSKFFKYVRYVSNQVSIDYTNSITCFSFLTKRFNLSRIDIAKVRKERNSNRVYNNRMTSNLISWGHIKNANKLIKRKFSIPIYEDILLDALDGFYKNDCRKTIIYSAIAIESMMAVKLDEIFEGIINSKNDKSYRVVEFTTHSGTDSKDPIFEKLCERTSFSSLLHERCLYVLNKSLLIENQDLYKSALSLYSTRNKIVHLGEPENGETNKYLEVNIEGAMEAYNIAVDIFNWMGILKYEKVVPLEFIELK